MISLSPFRRAAFLLAATVFLGVTGCEHACTLIGCLEGLNIRLGGKFEVGKTYDVKISTVTTTPEVVPIMRCSLLRISNNQSDLRCSSAWAHSERGDGVQIRGDEIKNIVVSISAGGVELGEQRLDARYTTEEINGPGCGTCTSAQVEVTIP